MAVKWYDHEVRVKLDQAIAEMVDKAAFLVEGQTKINITDNGQVDTGFMRNSVYAVTPKSDTYGQAHSAASGAASEKNMAPKADPPRDGAVVGVGAEYAIFQEERTPFLYPALETVVARMGGQIVASGRKVMD